MRLTPTGRAMCRLVSGMHSREPVEARCTSPRCCRHSVRPSATPVRTDVHVDAEGLRQRLGMPRAKSAIVVLVDGLGYWNLNMKLGYAPYMRSLMNEPLNQRPISTCSPSTTTAAMATFGTGTCQD